MDRLYTPWRLDYVRDGERRGSECVFCACRDGGDEQAHILHRSRHWFVILNRYPYNGGHLLLVCNEHVGGLTECEPEAVTDLARLLAAAERAVRAVYQPHGVNAGYNGGAAAGAGIPGHFHVHLLPRWRADTNFMTVIGDARVIPETLDQTYAQLRPALAEALRGSGL
ncbi:MAG: HIT domain-containing protein [Candidatus Latescibacteria bacterium]|nr:HIT domain-containing protein [Candidatus Latescibacterota bacterium]